MSKTTAIAVQNNARAIVAARQGNAQGLAEALGNDPVKVAEFALELRRESVAVIGDYEAFVRHTPGGSLRQIVKKVPLGLGDGTVWQIKKRQPVCTVQDHDCYGKAIDTRSHKSGYRWMEAVVGDPGKAELSYTGYLRLNAVASCAVGQPPVVIVDGEQKTNPFVERMKRPDGRPGDICRIVIAVVVVGPAPATGNPTVVSYTLDYDPTKDFAHMLARIAKDHPDDCKLANEWEVGLEDNRKEGWAFLPVAVGIGYHFNLQIEAVREAMADYINIQGQAMKKAQTVARRNAMKAHPALGGVAQSVRIDANGRAFLAGVGWCPTDGRDLERWQEIQERLSKGLDIPDDVDVDVINAEDTYDPDAHDGPTGDPEDAPPSEEPEPPASDEQAERNGLIEEIDQAIMLLDDQEIRSLEYDPGGMTIEQLQEVRARISGLVDAKE